MLRPYHRAQGRRKVGPYEVHLAAGRGGIRAEPILFNAIRLAFLLMKDAVGLAALTWSQAGVTIGRRAVSGRG